LYVEYVVDLWEPASPNEIGGASVTIYQGSSGVSKTAIFGTTANYIYGDGNVLYNGGIAYASNNCQVYLMPGEYWVYMYATGTGVEFVVSAGTGTTAAILDQYNAGGATFGFSTFKVQVTNTGNFASATPNYALLIDGHTDSTTITTFKLIAIRSHVGYANMQVSRPVPTDVKDSNDTETEDDEDVRKGIEGWELVLKKKDEHIDMLKKALAALGKSPVA